jgi:Recombinase
MAQCFECQQEATVRHHVVPRSLGGTAVVDLCGPCHGKAHHSSRSMTTSHLTKLALAAKRNAGERTGQVPFGWQADDDGRLVEDANEQNVLTKIKALRATSISIRKIAAILTSAGIVTKKGGSAWCPSTVQSILKERTTTRLT